MAPKALTCLLIIPALILPACNVAQHSPTGVYQPFELWQDPVYDPETNEMTVYFKSQPLDGQDRLPRDLSVVLRLAGADMQASVLPPGWFTNKPIMAVSVQGASFLPPTATVTAEVYQGETKVQTLTLTYSFTPYAQAIVDGTSAPAVAP
jgi:hypothetical protein